MASRSRSTDREDEDEGGFRPIEVPIPQTSVPLIVSAVDQDGTPLPDETSSTADTSKES